MRIKLSEIEGVFEILLKHLKAEGKTDFEIKDDYYWAIPKEKVYNPLEEPRDFTLGQLSDDWGELQKLLSKENEAIGFNLVWLASILRYIGEKNPA